MRERILILGIGRPCFGDDAAGLEAAGMLAGRLRGIARVRGDDSGGWSLLHAAEDVGLLVIVDAAEEAAGFPAGRWCRLRYPEDAGALVGARLRGTHSSGVPEVLGVAASLGRLPAEIWIYAVAGSVFAPETALSPDVAASIEGLARAVEEDVRAWLDGRGSLRSRTGALDTG